MLILFGSIKKYKKYYIANKRQFITDKIHSSNNKRVTYWNKKL